MKKKDLTSGNITKTMLLFALPMILGNLLQQLYNIADTLIVGQFLGSNAFAAVGSSYNDFFDFNPSRSLYGKRRRIFHLLRGEKHGAVKAQHLCFFSSGGSLYDDTEPGCISFY